MVETRWCSLCQHAAGLCSAKSSVGVRTLLSTCPPHCLSVHLTVCPSTSLSVHSPHYLPIHLTTCLFTSLLVCSPHYLSIHLTVCPFTSLSAYSPHYLSIHLTTCLFTSLSVYPPHCLSIHLTVICAQHVAGGVGVRTTMWIADTYSLGTLAPCILNASARYSTRLSLQRDAQPLRLLTMQHLRPPTQLGGTMLHTTRGCSLWLPMRRTLSIVRVRTAFGLPR